MTMQRRDIRGCLSATGSPNAGLRANDRGAVSPFITVVFLAIAALLALVVDGGRALAAHEAAITEAGQAARAGATVLSVGSLYEGTPVLAAAQAVSVARFDMALAGHPGTASVQGQSVVASVTDYSLATTLLAFLGITSFKVGATAIAAEVSG